MIKILAHRGIWYSSDEKNTHNALKRAIEQGFGFESDIRDYKGDLVISHDIANAGCQKAEEIFQWLSDSDDEFCFAINIKADGLDRLLQQMLNKYHLNNYFAFDMSVPQMIAYKDAGLNFFTRQSEIEMLPCMYDLAKGVWIDGFWGTDWITRELLENHIKNAKKICIVSPELHQRDDYLLFWKRLKEYDLKSKDIYLCTDYPERAKVFFENGE